MRRRRALAAGIVALLLGACGVPTDDSARRIPDQDVPFDLIGPVRTTTTAP